MSQITDDQRLREIAGAVAAKRNNGNQSPMLLEQSRDTVLGISIYGASNRAPDLQAESEQLGRELLMPAPWVQRNLETARQMAARRKMRRQVDLSSDRIREWMSDPSNATLSQDDVEWLRKIDEQINPDGGFLGIEGREALMSRHPTLDIKYREETKSERQRQADNARRARETGLRPAAETLNPFLPSGGPGWDQDKTKAAVDELRTFYREERKAPGRAVFLPGGEHADKKRSVGEALYEVYKDPIRLVPFLRQLPEFGQAYDLFMASRRMSEGTETDYDAKLILEMDHRLRRGDSFAAGLIDMTTMLAPYFLEFATTAGVGATVETAVEQGVLAAAKKYATGAMRRRIVRQGVRKLAWTGGTIIGAAAQAPLAIPGSMVADYVRRQTPAYAGVSGEGDQIQFLFEDAEDPAFMSAIKAYGGGVIEMWSERAGGQLIQGAVGGMARRIGVADRVKAMKAWVAVNWFRRNPGSTWDTFFQRVGSQAGWNGVLTEIGEEEIGKALRYITRVDSVYQPTTPEEFLQQFLAFGVFPVGRTAAQFTASFFQARSARARALQSQSFFEALGGAVQNSKTYKRMPSKMRDYVDRVAADGPVQTVYAPTDTWVEYWQSAGEDPAMIAARMTGIPTALEDALDAGHDLAIPIGAYASDIAGVPAHNEYFQSEVRIHPSHLNAREAEEQRAELVQQFDNAGMSDETVAAEEGLQVQIASQLVAVGMSETEADANATLFARVLAVTSERSGVPIADLAARLPVIGDELRYQQDVADAGATPDIPIDRGSMRRAQDLGQAVVDFATDALRQISLGGLFQGKAANRRGAFRFDPATGQAAIYLFGKSNRSTFLHESAHFYLELLGDLVTTGKANDQQKADYATLLGWFKVESRDQIGDDQHEQFARGWEAYVMSGEAPSSALRRLFARFKLWLEMLYRHVQLLGVKITPSIRNVFDRLAATDAEIDAAEAESGNAVGLFLTADDAGMSEDEFAAYRKKLDRASEEARDVLRAELMRNLRREQTETYREQRDVVRAEVETELLADRDHIARGVLSRGTAPNGLPLPEGVTAIKLDRASLIDAGVDEGQMRRLRQLRMYRREGGVSVAAAAESLGYTSADELVQAMVSSESFNDAVKRETDRRMDERYPDLLHDDIALREEADAAMNNQLRGEVIRRELIALRRLMAIAEPVARQRVAVERQSGRDHLAVAKDTIEALKEQARIRNRTRREVLGDIPPLDVFREAAVDIISGRRIRDIRPFEYLSTSRREARAATAAFRKGDYTAAADHKRAELMNHELWRVARGAVQKAEKIRNRMMKFTTDSTKRRIGKVGGNYLEQILGIINRFEFARVINKELDRREKLAAWIKHKEQDAEDTDGVVITEEMASLVDEARTTNWRQLTIDQLTEIDEAVKNIAHLASLKRKLIAGKERRELDATINSIIGTMEATKPARRDILEPRLPGPSKIRALEGFLIGHRKFASLVRVMDGIEDGGPLWDALIRPGNAAADAQGDMQYEATVKLMDIFSVLDGGDKLGEKQHIPSLDAGLSRGARLTVALHWGNPEGRERLLDTGLDGAGKRFGFTQQQIDDILATLTDADWEFVQQTWVYLETYWSQIAELEKETTGLPPKKVDAVPFITPTGREVTGGYYPLKYEDRRSSQARQQIITEIMKGNMRGTGARAMTRHGHTEARKQSVDLPVRLDLDVIFEHVGEVIHDLTHRRYLINANKILRDRDLRHIITERYGDQAYKELIAAVRDIATGGQPALNWIDRTANTIRAGASISVMGWNLITSLKQFLGLTQSVVRVGPQWIARGLSRWLGGAVRMENVASAIMEKSSFMRHRSLTLNREINDIRAQLQRRGKIMSNVQASYFYLIVKLQLVVDIPTWLGAYEKANAEGHNEAKAIALADSAVRDSQGSGQVIDLASVQRGSPIQKLFTVFYSYANLTFNQTAERAEALRQSGDSQLLLKAAINNPLAAGRFAVDLLLLYIVPAFLSVLLEELIRKDDDEKGLIKRTGVEAGSYIVGTMLGTRELTSAVLGFHGYEGPAGTRLFSEITRLVQQTSQGEADLSFWRSLNKSGGILFHYPAVQLERTFLGLKGVLEGEDPIYAILFGPQRKRDRNK